MELCCVDVLKLKTLKGLALEDILQLVHTYVHRSKCSQTLRSDLNDLCHYLCAFCS